MFDQSESIAKLAPALIKAQSEIRPAAESGNNTHLRSRYSNLNDVWAVLRKPCADAGLSVTQWPGAITSDHIAITTQITHESGEWMRGTIQIPVPDGKGINRAQQFGIAIAYACRYALKYSMGIVSGEDDVDAQGLDRPQQSPQRQTGMVRSARWQDLVGGKWRDCACPPASPYHNDQANLGDLQPADLKREWKREYETGSLHPAVVASLADRLSDMAMGELPMALKAAGWKGPVDFDEMAPGDVRAAHTALCNASKEGGAE